MIQLYVNLTRDKTMKKQFLFWLVVTALSIISPATAQENERQGAGGSGYIVDVLIMFLEAGADPNARDENGWTSLLYVAAVESNPDAITRLVEAGMDPNAREVDGWTALHVAVTFNNNLDVITRLVELGADIEARDGDGWTPLHFAGRFNKNHDIITRLLDLGADGTAKTDDGETVWDLARRGMSPLPWEILIDQKDHEVKTKYLIIEDVKEVQDNFARRNMRLSTSEETEVHVAGSDEDALMGISCKQISPPG